MGLEVVVGIDSEQVQGNFGRDEMLKKMNRLLFA